MLVKACEATDIFELNKKKEYTLTATCILESVLTNPNLNAQTVKLWQFLFNKARFNSNLEVRICYDELAKNLHRSSRSISRYVKTLVQEGYLLVDENFSKDGSQRPNTLYVRVPSIVIEEVKKKKDRVVNKDSFSSKNSELPSTDEPIISPYKSPATYSAAEYASTPTNQLRPETKYSMNLPINIQHIEKHSANTVSQHLPFIENDFTVYPLKMSSNDKIVMGEDDKIVVHKDNIKKEIILNNNTVVVDNSLNEYLETPVKLNFNLANTYPISDGSVLHETLAPLPDNEKYHVEEREINRLEAEVNSLYLEMTAANSEEKIIIFDKIKQLRSLATTISVDITQKKQLEANLARKLSLDKQPTSFIDPTINFSQVKGDRVLTQSDIVRITRMVNKHIADQDDQKRISNEIIYAIRFGSLRISQTGKLLSITHSTSIALKLLREKRWETPTQLQKPITSLFSRQEKDKFNQYLPRGQHAVKISQTMSSFLSTALEN